MLRAEKKIIFVLVALSAFLFCVKASNAEESLPPVLSISPREMNLGSIASGEAAFGLFTLKNMGSGNLSWSVKCPEGWRPPAGTDTSTSLRKKTDYLRVEILSFPLNEQLAEAQHSVEMKLETEDQTLICRKKLSEGAHKEAIKITSEGGNRTIFVTFFLSSVQEEALLNLNPTKLDMGSVLPGRTASRRVTLTNKGKEMLNWSVAVEKSKRDENTAEFKKGRYISFLSDEITEEGAYAVPAHLKEMMELAGRWTDNEGYPSGAEGENTMTLRFRGTGIVLYLLTCPDADSVGLYLDERPVTVGNCSEAIEKRNGELPVAAGLADAAHVLTIVSKDSRVIFEGVKIMGKKISRAPAGSIVIIPTAGTTLTQTNYLQVTFAGRELAPGYYGGNIVFTANNKQTIVELFAEVLPDNITKLTDIYRFSSADDYLYTAKPQEDVAKLGRGNYKKEGIAFRLYAPETPGTTPFYRWYNTWKRAHFYHHEQSGGGKNLQGYVFEGAIGNIATSKLTNSKELYRWYNPSSGRYFYTTDTRAANIKKRGYRFEGIAGYVK